MEIWDVYDAVNMAFWSAFNQGERYYSIKRIFWDQTLVCQDYDTKKNYLLSWSINEGKEVAFSPDNTDEWQEVEETWQPVQQRSIAPELRSFLGIHDPEAKEEKPTPDKKIKKEKRFQTTPKNINTTIGDTERRTVSGEVRADGKKEGRKIQGYAAVFGEETELFFGELVEEIAPGAFDNVLGDDVRALFNHDPNFVLGRNTSGTLRLSVDEKGLAYEIDVPETNIGNDLLMSVRRGDISQSSFGFTVVKDQWEALPDGRDKRTILEVGQLFDVSPVTYPAYATTEATARSRPSKQEEKEEVKDAVNADWQTPEWWHYRMLAKKRA